MKKIGIFILTLFFVFFTSMAKTNAYGFGFTRNDDHLPPDIGDLYEKELRDTSSYYVGDTSKKEIYLTFDVGYDNGELSKILDILDSENVKATFFLTGDFVTRFKELTITLSHSGHTIANHTYHHIDITKCSINQLEEECMKLEEAYFNCTNKQMAKFIRPPEGNFDHQSLKNLEKLGYTTVFWSSAYADWDVANQKQKTKVKELILNNLHPGCILLMHSVSSTNREVLPSLIHEIKEQGYEFKTVENLPCKKNKS